MKKNGGIALTSFLGKEWRQVLVHKKLGFFFVSTPV
jgi:hypothetical protein